MERSQSRKTAMSGLYTKRVQEFHTLDQKQPWSQETALFACSYGYAAHLSEYTRGLDAVYMRGSAETVEVYSTSVRGESCTSDWVWCNVTQRDVVFLPM